MTFSPFLCLNEEIMQCFFVNGAKRSMRELNIDEKELRDDLLVMWAAVHGLAAMANMKGVQYDSGDWGALTERLLLSKVML